MSYAVRDLCKAYQQKAVLQHISFSAEKGERLIITGPSGCGKTTLCRILAGLETPDSGTLEGFAGTRTSMVFQEDRLISFLSALENVLLVTKEEDTAKKALLQLGLTADDMQKPAAKLSGGQKRRVAIARALLAPGDLLILDEPFKGLDNETRSAVISYVKEMQKGRTLFFVTHEKAEAEAMGGTPIGLPIST